MDFFRVLLAVFICTTPLINAVHVNGAEEAQVQQFREWQKLSGEGNAEAQYMLSVAYRFGRGARINENLANYWLQQSAMQELPAAMYDLGMMSLSGNGMKENAPLGILMLESAAQKGYTNALTALGAYFLSSNRITPMINSLLADRYLRTAVSFEEPNAMCWLGFMYHHGYEPEADISAELDINSAIEWYSRGAELGALMCADGLAIIYQDQSYGHEDKMKSLFWFEVLITAGVQLSPKYAETHAFLVEDLGDLFSSKIKKKANDWYLAKQEELANAPLR